MIRRIAERQQDRSLGNTALCETNRSAAVARQRACSAQRRSEMQSGMNLQLHNITARARTCSPQSSMPDARTKFGDGGLDLRDPGQIEAPPLVHTDTVVEIP